MNKIRKEYRIRAWDKIKKTTKEYRLSHPWLKTLSNVRQRCSNPNFPKYKNYGGRGIKAEITSKEIKDLWFRDKAYEMKKPSIDRLDSNKNYTFDTCRFIEHKLNVQLGSIKTVYQFDLNNNFIKKWDSVIEAAQNTNQTSSNISGCCRKVQLTAGGYKWSYNYGLD